MTPAQLDAWRVVPRVLVAMYGMMVWRTSEWFMSMPDPTGPQATFVSVVIGAAGAFFGFYVNTGSKN